MPRLKAAHVVLSLATAFGASGVVAQSPNGAVPGTLNYIQGQANIDGQPISQGAAGSQRPQRIQAGQTFATANGSADILMAPGALLRLGDDATVQMVAEDAGRTEIRLEQGHANVSVNVVGHDRLLLVDMPNGQVQIVSRGLYTFNTATNTLRVFDGEANLFPGTDTASAVKPVKVKEGHEVILGGDRAKPEKFDRETESADLLPWTGPRESQAVLASNAVMYNGGGAGYGNAGYYPGAGYGGGYGFGFGGGYGYGDGLYDGYGYGPYAWGPYGFYGYPFFGVGYGFWGGGFYGGSVGGGYPPLKGPGRIGFGSGVRGGTTARGFAGEGRSLSATGARGFTGSGGAFHSGGGFSGGGGFHGGGSGGHR